MKTSSCINCMNYTKRYGGRCKLKEELIIIAKGKCNRFDKIPHTLVNRAKKQNKLANKKKEAKKCIGCVHNQEGWCSQYKVFAFHARNSCLDIKTRTAL